MTWQWQRNTQRRFGSALGYWWVTGPDGQRLAFTPAALREAWDRAERIGEDSPVVEQDPLMDVR